MPYNHAWFEYDPPNRSSLAAAVTRYICTQPQEAELKSDRSNENLIFQMLFTVFLMRHFFLIGLEDVEVVLRGRKVVKESHGEIKTMSASGGRDQEGWV